MLLKRSLFTVRESVKVTDSGSLPTRTVPLEHYRENLEEFAEICSGQGIDLLLITQAMPSLAAERDLAGYFTAMEEVSSGYDLVHYVDVRPSFAEARRREGIPYIEDLNLSLEEAQDFSDALFIDSCCHPTNRGYDIMTDAIERVVMENRLLRD